MVQKGTGAAARADVIFNVPTSRFETKWPEKERASGVTRQPERRLGKGGQTRASAPLLSIRRVGAYTERIPMIADFKGHHFVEDSEPGEPPSRHHCEQCGMEAMLRPDGSIFFNVECAAAAGKICGCYIRHECAQFPGTNSSQTAAVAGGACAAKKSIESRRQLSWMDSLTGICHAQLGRRMAPAGPRQTE